MLIRASQPPFPNKSLFPPAISGPSRHKPSPANCLSRRESQRLASARLEHCRARRRVRYEEDGNGEEEGVTEYGCNKDIAMLESYTESSRSHALLVRATVDGEEEVVLVFKGYSSSLSSRTAADPTKSVLPARAIIRSVDVIKGPFDPSCIHYIEKDLTWDEFKVRLHNPNISQ